MKKILLNAVLLLAILFAISGVTFAQELKLDGYINSGIGLIANNKDGTDALLKAAAVDAGHQGYRFRLNGSYSNEAKNAGIKFRLQSQTTLADGYFSMPYVFGWVSFLDSKLTLNGGIIEDSTWTTGDWWLASDSVSHFTGLGTLLKITPVEGLAIGAGFYPIGRKSGSSNNVLNTKTLADTPAWYDAKYTVHAAYTLKDVFRIGASFRSQNNAGAAETSLLYGDIRFLGVENLTAAAALRFDKLGDLNGESFKDNGNIVLSETFGYKIEDISFGLNAVQFLYNRGDADKDPGLLFNLWGQYALGNVVPRLDLVYFAGGKSNLSDNKDYFRTGFTNIESSADVDDDENSVFSVRPSVKINLDGKTFIEIGDMLSIDMKKKGFDGEDSLLSNAIYVDLKWSF